MSLIPERLTQIEDLRDWMTYLPEGPWFVSDCEGTLQVWREAVIRVTGRTEAGAIATYKTPSVYSRTDLLFEAQLDTWDHGMDEDDDVIRAVALFLALARDLMPDLLAEVDRLTAERDSWKKATDDTGLALAEINRQRGEFQDRANAAEAEIARLTAERDRAEAERDTIMDGLIRLHSVVTPIEQTNAAVAMVMSATTTLLRKHGVFGPPAPLSEEADHG